jgi:hypothetical protein
LINLENVWKIFLKNNKEKIGKFKTKWIKADKFEREKNSSTYFFKTDK